MPSRALGTPSDACVFIYLHRTKAETWEDYKRLVTEFLPEKFDHPVYLYLRPDGTEIDPELRNYHMAISAGQIVKVLKKRVWPVTGKGLKPKDWTKAEDAVKAAQEAMDAGEFRKAESLLAPVLKLKPSCGVRDRANMLKTDIACRLDMLGVWDALAAEAPDAPAGVRDLIAGGDFLAARKKLRPGTRAIEPFGALVDKMEDAIRAGFTLKIATHEFVIFESRVHQYLRATYTCGLDKVSGLKLEFSVLSTEDDVLDGWALYKAVPRCSLLMSCGTLTSRALDGNLIKAIRVRLFHGDLLVAEKCSDGAPAAWPDPTQEDLIVGPEFYHPGKAYNVSGALEIERIIIGRVR